MKKALIIAIDAYPAPYTTRNNINDLLDLQNTLLAKGFSISILTDYQATRSNILGALQNTVSNATSSDNLVIAFFGHGSYIVGNEPDGRTECICPVDVMSGNLITDDELAAVLAGLPSCSCDVILGCCYSGTGTRALSEGNEKPSNKKFKELSCTCIPGPLTSSVLPKLSVVVSSMNHVLWAACKDNQLAYSGLSGGKYRGIFPTYLCYAMRMWPNKTRSEIDAYVTVKVKAVSASQDTQTEGTSLELSQPLFT